ncbi:MAG: tetratricopeptide repeat protein [Pseudomonadota bacterium]
MIRRLRDPKAPSTSELIRDMSTLEMLIARFPTWLALITSVENIRRWRELDEAVPTWRRKLTFARSRPEAPFEKQAKPGGFNWAWIFMVGLIMIGRAFFGSGHGSHGVDQAQWPAHIESQAQSETPNSANDFVRRGDEYLKQDDLDGAWGGFDRAIQLEPKNPTAHLGRGMVYMLRYDNERAAKDFDDAEAFDPRNAILLRCRGILAMRAGRITDAIQAYSKSLELNPADAYARKLRAHAYQSDKQLDKALADADEVIRLRPSYLEAYKLRARIFMDKGDREKAKAQLELVLEHKADDAAAYTIAADIHRTLGNATEAMALLDRAVKDQNSASAYLARAARRPASDVEGRRSDIEATLKLEPTSVEALGTLAALDMESHRYADAIAAYDAALSAMATSDYGRSALVANRGVARTQLGEKAAADDDFMTAIRISRTASELNNICWTLAVKNVALSHALNSCNASLDQAPANAATLDSKGFVLLRMARYAEALKAYNASLKQRPGQADSQYCRGIVKRRLGDMRGGDADIATASARDSTLVKRFSAMGVNP